MAKKVAVKKPRVSKFETYKTNTVAFLDKIRNRGCVQHSSTPVVATKNGVTGKATVEVAEMITVVKTAEALGKIVVLRATNTELIVNLEDRVPLVPGALLW